MSPFLRWWRVEACASVHMLTVSECLCMLRTDKEVKPHVNIVFIGHVDAGKSTMGGNILYLCGMVDKRTLEKYEREAKEAGRESWYLSWALDSTSQEREKVRTSSRTALHSEILLLSLFEKAAKLINGGVALRGQTGQDGRSRTRLL